MRQAHCQSIIPARCTADTDTQTRTDTDEDGSDDRRCPRIILQTLIDRGRQNITDRFKQRIKQRKSRAGEQRIDEKPPSEQPPAEQITQCIEDKRGNGWRDFEMMLQQKRGAEHTALRHAGKGMHMIKSECLYRTAEQQKQ